MHRLQIGIKFYDGKESSEGQRLKLRYSCLPDINSRMPRAEAAEIFNQIKKIGE